LFTQWQMSQLGAGGGGRPLKPGAGQVLSHLVNQPRHHPGRASGPGGAGRGRLGEVPPPGRSPIPSATISKLLVHPHGWWWWWWWGGVPVITATRFPPLDQRVADLFQALPSPPQEKGTLLQSLPKLHHILRPETSSPATQVTTPIPMPLGQPRRVPPCPGARPGPDSEVAWHCNSLSFNSSGTHYATWHQPLTWLQAGELPGGVRAGSLPGAPLRRRRAISPLGAS
jgi:hypothetical protein